jgi:hypothetical protein
MREVAQFLVDVVVTKKKPADVAQKVAQFRERFKGIHYCYDDGAPAYKFWRLA